MRKIFLSLLVSALCMPAMARTRVSVDMGQVVAHVSPLIYGSGLEDVNHEVYGGIYDQRIFGESFEEGPQLHAIADFTGYDAPWRQTEEGFVGTYAAPWAKLIYDKALTQKGWAETEIRYDGMTGHAGLLVEVSEAGKGKESLTGYEVCLSAWTRELILNRYEGKCQTLCRIPLSFEPTVAWNSLRVDFNGGRLVVKFNGRSVLSYTDSLRGLAPGRMGLRTNGANVMFRRLSLNDGKETRNFDFDLRNNGLSRMWASVEKEGATGVFCIDTTTTANGRQSQRMENPGVGMLGISNSGLNRWGIAFKKGRPVQGSICLKGAAKNIRVALESQDGTREYASAAITGVTNDWKTFSFRLNPKSSDPKGRFVLYFEGKGCLWVDQAMLFAQEKDQYKGLPFRKDIAQGIVDEGITFLRYGGSMVNSPEYMTAGMMGPRGQRPPYRGTWYRESTNGFGIIEFVQLAKAAGMEPSFAINMEDRPEDVARLIEYLNGDAKTTAGGRQRAFEGHAEPYGVKYVELGNEEVIQKDTKEGYLHYIERCNLLTEAMRKVDPDLQFVCAAWWRPKSLENMEMVFRALDGNCAYWDYHPWVEDFVGTKKVLPTLKQMKELFLQWNPQTKMRCAIFEENGDIHNVQRMLAHALALNAVRQMGDFVLTSCQANALQPNGQNDNGWDQGQVFFNPSQVWHQPTSYIVQMDRRWHQPLCIKSDVESDEDINIAAMCSEDRHTLVLHVVNTSEKERDLEIDLSSFGRPRHAQAESLGGALSDDNSCHQPFRIVPRKQRITPDGRFTIAPYTYTILIYQK